MTSDAQPVVSHELPRPARWLTWLGRAFLRVSGWKVEGNLPADLRHGIALGLPHTSNWDLPYALAIAWALGVSPQWFGKHTLFRGPVGWILRAAGGIPLRRDDARGVVDSVASLFVEHPEGLLLVVQPEGTRSWRPYWKSGFYRIARKAQVPVVCSFLDFDRRVGGVKDSFMLTGDVAADMGRIRAAYDGVMGLYPELSAPMKLRVEDESDSDSTLELGAEPGSDSASRSPA